MRDLEVKVVRWLMHIRSANRAAMCWLSNVHSLITNPPLLMTVTYLEPGVRVLVYSTEAKVCRTSGQATLKKVSPFKECGLFCGHVGHLGFLHPERVIPLGCI